MNGLDINTPPTILVVDDMPDNLALMSSLLKDEYKVKVANGGEKALEVAASDAPPDLILLDVMMPGMDGYEVCRRLKRDPRTRSIPVIFLTARSEEAEEKKGLELGAIDYITKPISPPIVMARVRNHLALKAIADFLRDQNDWDSATRLAYTLKGDSGRIGVAGLQPFVEKLEVAVNMRRSLLEGDVRPDDGLSTQFDRLFAQLETNLPEGPYQSAITVDRGKLKVLCDKLEALMAEGDAKPVDVLDAKAANLMRSSKRGE